MKVDIDDIVLCTVKKIEGATVFLEIDGDGEGSMIFSEVSPGRIRNIRDFVTVGKKVVCKVLRINGKHIELSLRRVTSKEKEFVLEAKKKEKILESILKTALKDKYEQVLEKIKEKYAPSEFLEDARKDPELLSEFVSKSEVEQLKKIMAEKKDKEKEVRKKIIITSSTDSGITQIKEALEEGEDKRTEIRYDGSSQFSIYSRAEDFKKANKQIDDALERIKRKAKSLHLHLEIK